MSPDWLLHEGRVFADALVLSHDDQVKQLAGAVPAAVPHAVVTGDPCFDRMRASRPLRHQYRRALGVEDGATLVVLSTTWGPHSLLGSWPELPRQLLAELPVDSHRVALVVHPNALYAHGSFQLASWLADCIRAGLVLVPPAAGWQQTVLAADLVVGDNGAVSGYSAAIGRPTMLAAFPDDEVVPGTAIDALGKAAPRLDPGRPLRNQIDTAIHEFRPDRFAAVTELTSSLPDRSAARLRTLFYRLMNLDEPAPEAPVHCLPARDLPAPRDEIPATLAAGDVRTEPWPDDRPGATRTVVRLSRLPVDVIHGHPPRMPDVDGHLVVHLDHPFRTLHGNAAVLYRHAAELDAPAPAWLAGTLDRWPCCLLTAVLEPTGDCLLYGGPGRLLRLSPETAGMDPVTPASMLYLWLTHGGTWESVPDRMWLDAGCGPRPVRVARS